MLAPPGGWLRYSSTDGTQVEVEKVPLLHHLNHENNIHVTDKFYMASRGRPHRRTPPAAEPHVPSADMERPYQLFCSQPLGGQTDAVASSDVGHVVEGVQRAV